MTSILMRFWKKRSKGNAGIKVKKSKGVKVINNTVAGFDNGIDTQENEDISLKGNRVYQTRKNLLKSRLFWTIIGIGIMSVSLVLYAYDLFWQDEMIVSPLPQIEKEEAVIPAAIRNGGIGTIITDNYIERGQGDGIVNTPEAEDTFVARNTIVP